MPPAEEHGPSLTLSALHAGYARGALGPAQLVARVFDRIADEPENPIWISLRSREEVLAEAEALAARSDGRGLPLYGVPYAVKDNIDVAGMPTTAGCPAFSYTPSRSATVVDQLRAAGALLIGKTNLDQFATGLVGVRSPFGAVRNPFDSSYISGGSSSGSAVAVARGLVSFALGTDTAGSGRVPAAYCGVVGCKPTRGLFSAAGVVPACRTLDCVSVFTANVADAARVFSLLDVFDPADAHAREARQPAERKAPLRIGVPPARNLEFFGDAEYRVLFAAAVARLATLDFTLVEVDIEPFLQAGTLLYEGPWVAERHAAVGQFIARHPDSVHGVVREIIERGAHHSAADAFRGLYRLQELRRETARAWASMDALLLPTAGTIYKIAEIEQSPIALNANLGRYTNFANLLDLAGLALPAGFRRDGLPFGITLLAPALQDWLLLELGERWEAGRGDTSAIPAPGGSTVRGQASGSRVRLAVVGAHLSGQPLNGQLLSRGATLLKGCRTAPLYRLFALKGTSPPKPGLVRGASGAAIDVEIWEMPVDALGSFVAGVPPPLTIGTLLMEDGEQVLGFLCEDYAVQEARDITAFGGWRAYLEDKKK